MGQSAHPFFDLHTHGFVRAATCTPCVRPADVSGNAKSIVQIARDAHEAGVDLAVYPELCVTGYAIDDLHLQSAVIDAAEAAVGRIIEESAGLTPVLVIGAPVRRGHRLYNCALAIANGSLLGVVPNRFQQDNEQPVNLDTLFRMARGRAPSGTPAARRRRPAK